MKKSVKVQPAMSKAKAKARVKAEPLLRDTTTGWGSYSATAEKYMLLLGQHEAAMTFFASLGEPGSFGGGQLLYNLNITCKTCGINKFSEGTFADEWDACGDVLHNRSARCPECAMHCTGCEGFACGECPKSAVFDMKCPEHPDGGPLCDACAVVCVSCDKRICKDCPYDNCRCEASPHCEECAGDMEGRIFESTVVQGDVECPKCHVPESLSSKS